MKTKEIQEIGEIGNYYGGLKVRECDGRYYWSIEDYDGDHWEEIPFRLYCELLSFNEEPKETEWPAMSDKFYEGLGWMHAECCAALDQGEDPRAFEVGDMVKRCIHDLTRSQPPKSKEGE